MSQTEIVRQIAGVSFRLTPRYSEGHRLDAAEANALNLVMYENIGRNFRARVEKAQAECGVFAGSAFPLPAEVHSDLQSEFSTYFSSYRFGLGSSAAIDPIERLARKLAKEAIMAALRKQGKEPKSTDWLEEQISRNLDNNSRFMDTARQRIAEQNIAANEVLAGFELGGD